MKDKRLKYFQIAALFLIQKGEKFEFNGKNYLRSSLFELSHDANDKSKVWVEETNYEGTWKSFTDVNIFKSYLLKK